MKDKLKIKNNGFTLVELLVVISIISILTVISLGSYTSVQIKARDAQRKSDLNAVSKALMLYFSDTGSLPSFSNTPSNGVLTFGDESIGLRSVDGGTIYMRKTPKDPKNLDEYIYAYNFSADGKKFNLYANLENKKDSQCNGAYVFNTKTYCYGISSPNTTVNVNLP